MKALEFDLINEKFDDETEEIAAEDERLASLICSWQNLWKVKF